jgi:A/G-specific adenine glycosylase
MHELSKKNLLDWYLSNKRELVFRKTKDPYKIWVSEVMLQQTRINHMLPKFENFITRFTTILSLADSTEEEVLEYWQGLGYYSRALNLRKAAIHIKEKFNSIFPSDIKEVLKLPGIGAYTARAVLSIAFNQAYAVLDGNVKRVLSRYFLFKENISLPKSHSKLQELADEFLNPENPSDHNQAMMELGSLICTPIKPDCKICPLNKNCLALSKDCTEVLPIQAKDKKQIEISILFFLFELDDKLVFYKSSERRFFKKISTLPFIINGTSLNNKYSDNSIIGNLMKNLLKETEPIFFGEHSITHHKIKLFYIQKKLNNKLYSLFLNSPEVIWGTKKDLLKYFTSSIAIKLNKVINYA